MAANFDCMLKVIGKVSDTKNDPNQISVNKGNVLQYFEMEWKKYFE